MPVQPREMTAEEKKWVGALRRVLKRCPQTLELLTTGDHYLDVIDKALAGGPLCDGQADDRGAVLATVGPLPCAVHGVSG